MATKNPSPKRSDSRVERYKSSQTHNSAIKIMEELFYDFHRNRKQIYMMNFVRGIMFGLGSVLGGTIVIAVIIWMLSLFSDTWLGPIVQEVVNTVEQSGE